MPKKNPKAQAAKAREASKVRSTPVLISFLKKQHKKESLDPTFVPIVDDSDADQENHMVTTGQLVRFIAF